MSNRIKLYELERAIHRQTHKKEKRQLITYIGALLVLVVDLETRIAKFEKLFNSLQIL